MNGLQHTSAFVVQFRTDADFEGDRAGGRVEHVASGRSAHFESIDELMMLFARLLKEVESVSAKRSDHDNREAGYAQPGKQIADA